MKEDYTEIPDAEENTAGRDLVTPPKRTRASLRGSKRKSTKLLNFMSNVLPENLYPQASSFEEAELLTLLDEIMDQPRLNLKVPHIHEDDVTTVTHSYCLAVIIPTLFTAFMFGVAVFVGTSQAPAILEISFPYLTALVIFIASARSIDARIIDQAAFVFDRVHHCNAKLSQMIDSNVASVETKIERVVECLDPVTNVMNNKLAGLPSIADLRQIDPTLEVPDIPSSREFDAPMNAVRLRSERTKVDVKIHHFVPPYLESPEAYRAAKVFPLLMFFIFLQMGTMWFLDQFLLSIAVVHGEDIEGGLEESFRSRFLRGSVHNFTENNLAVTSLGSATIGSFQLGDDIWQDLVTALTPPAIIADAWKYILLTLVSYTIALIQIWCVYNTTTRVQVAEETNAVIDDFSLEAQRIAREEGFVNRVELVLGFYMIDMKERLLATIDMIRRMQSAKRSWEIQKAEQLRVLNQSPLSVPTHNGGDDKSVASTRSSASNRIRNMGKKARMGRIGKGKTKKG